jgi:hypothetical protein
MKLLPHVLALSLSICATSSLPAAVVSYPESNPAFTLDLPKGWTVARQGGGVLMLTPEGGNAVLMLRRAEHMKDERDAKTEMAAMVEEAKKIFTLHDVEAKGAPKEKEIGEIKCLEGTYSAKDDKGNGAHFQLTLFAARAGEFFVMTELYNDAHEVETVFDRTLLVSSLKPVSGK